MLKTAAQMNKMSGIGKNKLHELIENRKFAYVPNGNRRLIATAAVEKWYKNAKIPVSLSAESKG
ncbi:MAG: DNA-binding protein [Oscillospiraceae bacterium]|nr:DNA-binding protein [Oscillospiraceae bacterium]